ncbi:MAG: sodium:solute symporter family protein [Acidobacteria bacterium]|nr:sodium:solute symporter family protein [Acidobacteriota bacterium]
MSLYLIAVIAYLAALAAVAYWRSRTVTTGDDFLVAGRTLPAHVLVFTLLSTWIGSGSLFAGAGLGYRVGFAALWQSAGAWVGIALIYFIAPRVRRIAQYTVPDILELRYGPAARVLGTITIVLAYTTIAAYQFRGGGRLLQVVSGLDSRTGALVTAAFCVAYTVFAGMSSLAYLDIANGVMMLVGVGLAVVYLVGHAGGTGPALAALRPDQLTVFGTISPLDALALFLPTMFLLLGEANMYQKFFSARNERVARLAVIGWIVGTVIVETLIDSVGVLGSVAIPGLNTPESETIVIRVALDVLPTILGLLLLAGGAAIIVSTATSMLLTPATNLMRDVYQRFINPQVTSQQVLTYTRALVIVLGVAAFVAGNFFPTILAMALWAYTMYGAGITPALLAAFVWPRATPRGGVASIAVGMTVTILWEIVGLTRGTSSTPAYLFGLSTVYPALLLSIGTLIVVSLSEKRGEA